MIACIFMCSIWMVTRRYSPPFKLSSPYVSHLAVLSVSWFSLLLFCTFLTPRTVAIRLNLTTFVVGLADTVCTADSILRHLCSGL